MLGYWERPDATAEALAGGELHTGDVGFLDDDGYLHLRDRKSLRDHPRRRQRLPGRGRAGAARGARASPPARCSASPTSASASGWWPSSRPTRGSTRTPSRAHCEANLAKYKVPERFVRGRPAPPERHGQDRPHRARPALLD